MATSGTYAFGLQNADIIGEAFERCGLMADQIAGYQARSARISMDLLFKEWANRGVRLWSVEALSVTLTAGTNTYDTAAGTIDILDLTYKQETDGIENLLAPISREEYVAQADKAQQSRPTQFWVDRILPSPKIVLWPTPDTDGDSITYWRLREIQDAGDPNMSPEIPTLWLDAICAGLAARLAQKWKPERMVDLQAMAERAFGIASGENRERVPFSARPDVSYLS